MPTLSECVAELDALRQELFGSPVPEEAIQVDVKEDETTDTLLKDLDFTSMIGSSNFNTTVQYTIVSTTATSGAAGGGTIYVQSVPVTTAPATTAPAAATAINVPVTDRIGRFKYVRDILDLAPEVLQDLYSQVLPLDVRYDYASQTFHVTAMSYHFDPCPLGAMQSPEYSVTYDTLSQTWTFSRLP